MDERYMVVMVIIEDHPAALEELATSGPVIGWADVLVDLSLEEAEEALGRGLGQG